MINKNQSGDQTGAADIGPRTPKTEASKPTEPQRLESEPSLNLFAKRLSEVASAVFNK